MLNTSNVAFVSSENALLSLMSIMFNLQNKPDLEFKIKQFLSCYKLFFTSTLPYEALSMTMRLKLYEEANKYNQNTYVNGIAVGSFVQYLTYPLFKLNIGNHNYQLSDLSRSQFH